LLNEFKTKTEISYNDLAVEFKEKSIPDLKDVLRKVKKSNTPNVSSLVPANGATLIQLYHGFEKISNFEEIKASWIGRNKHFKQ